MRMPLRTNRPRRRTNAASLPVNVFCRATRCALSALAVLTILICGCAKTQELAEPVTASASPPSPAPATASAPAANAGYAAAPSAGLENVSPKARGAYLQGYALMANKDWNGALAAFSAAFAEAPDMAGAYEGAGLAALELGRMGEAAGYFEKAAFLDPGQWSPHAYLAGIYRSQGRQELFAEECFAVISMAKGEQDRAAAAIMQAHDKAKAAAFGQAGDAGANLRVEVSELTQANAPATFPAATPLAMPAAPAQVQAYSSPIKPGETRSGVLPVDDAAPMPGYSPDAAGRRPAPQTPALQTPYAQRAPDRQAEEERLATARALMAQAEAQAQAQVEAKADAEAKALAETRAKEEAKAKTETQARAQTERPASAPKAAAPQAKTAEPKKTADRPKAPKKGKSFTILESSWDSREKAEARAAALRGRDIPARADTVSMSGRGVFFRVLIGDYASLSDAREAADSLAARADLSGLLPIRP